MVLDDLLQPGQSFHIFYYKGNPNNRLVHVRGIVDDQIVTRSWGYHRCRWLYGVDEC